VNRFESVVEEELVLRAKQRHLSERRLLGEDNSGSLCIYFEEFLDMLNTFCCYKEEGITVNQ